jgi:hypothetical protein
MKEKNYAQAVEAYKNALRNNPSDEQTRYNYALAKKFLKENPPPKDEKKDKEDKKEKDKEDEKKPDPKKEDKKDPEPKPDNEGQPKEDKPKPQEKPKPQGGGISKQRLENLLEAVNNEEKKIQNKVNKKKVKGRPTETEKDW